MALPQTGSILHAYRASLQTSAFPTVDDSEGSADATGTGISLSPDGEWYQFADASSRILTPTNSQTGSYTVLLRVRRRPGADWDTTTHNFMSVASGSTFATLLYIDGNIRSFQRNLLSDTGYDPIDEETGWQEGDPHAIMLRYNAATSTLHFFADNSATPFFERTGLNAATASSALIYGAYVSSNGWGNDMSDVVHWDTALSDAEVVEAFDEVTPSNDNAGTGGAALDDAATSGAGSLAVAGSGSSTLEDAGTSGAGALSISGSGTSTLEEASAAGAGSLAISGTGSSTLEDAATSGAGNLTSVGSGSGGSTLEDAEGSGSGSVALSGTGAATLDDGVNVGSGSVAIESVGAATLDDATTSGAGTMPVADGIGAATLDDAATAASGSLSISGAGTSTLGDAAGSGSATLSITGTGSTGLDDAETNGEQSPYAELSGISGTYTPPTARFTAAYSAPAARFTGTYTAP